MPLTAYLSALRRRWLLILIVLLLDSAVSGFLLARSHQRLGYSSCLTLYVADVSSPSMIAAPTTTLQSTGQLLAGETAANFFADDVLDVAKSRVVTSYLSNRMRAVKAANSDLTGAISGSRLDRTVDLCVSNRSSATALLAARQLGHAMTTDRARFVGKAVARRTFVKVVSPATVGRESSSHQLLDFGLRLILGLLVALGLALLWDALDPKVRDRRDVENALRVPVLAVSR